MNPPDSPAPSPVAPGEQETVKRQECRHCGCINPILPAPAPSGEEEEDALVQAYHDAMEAFWSLPQEADHAMYVKDMETTRAAILSHVASLHQRLQQAERAMGVLANTVNKNYDRATRAEQQVADMLAREDRAIALLQRLRMTMDAADPSKVVSVTGEAIAELAPRYTRADFEALAKVAASLQPLATDEKEGV